jgi:hypothetical protein
MAELSWRGSTTEDRGDSSRSWCVEVSVTVMVAIVIVVCRCVRMVEAGGVEGGCCRRSGAVGSVIEVC